MILQVFSVDGQQSVDVKVEGIESTHYETITAYLDSEIRGNRQRSDVVAESFLMALKLCPQSNPADLWWHVIYQTYRRQFSDQSWKRTAGYALEISYTRFYNPLLKNQGIRLNRLGGGAKARTVMEEMGIAGQVGKSKLDIVLQGQCNDGTWRVFGGIHVKASLAERIQDDVPASLAMMAAGYWSPFFTLDAKAFPPPHGDGVVRGELGYRTDPEGAIKRHYFERDGQFDNCYSYNLRIPPSRKDTPSGKRIYTLNFSDEKPDRFMLDAAAQWQSRRQELCGKSVR